MEQPICTFGFALQRDTAMASEALALADYHYEEEEFVTVI